MATKKDYYLVTIVGVLFGVLLFPVLKNIQVPFSLNLITVILMVIFFGVFANIALFIASLIAKKIPVMFQFAKFGAVGALNSLVDWGILNVLILITGESIGIQYTAFKAISFIVANINSYYWNKFWVFNYQDKANTKEFGQFMAVSVIGLVINASVAALIVNVFATDALSPARWANIGAAVATLASLGWNFIGYKFIVFKKSPSGAPQVS